MPLLIENDIQWIMIWSKINPKFKTELIYDPINSKVNIKTGKIDTLDKYNEQLLKIGVTEFKTTYEYSIFKLMPNAKMITDVIYLVFEEIHQLNGFFNHKIVTSSG